MKVLQIAVHQVFSWKIEWLKRLLVAPVVLAWMWQTARIAHLPADSAWRSHLVGHHGFYLHVVLFCAGFCFECFLLLACKVYSAICSFGGVSVLWAVTVAYEMAADELMKSAPSYGQLAVHRMNEHPWRRLSISWSACGEFCFGKARTWRRVAKPHW